MMGDWEGKPDKGSIDKKTLRNERKNRQIEIDEKPPNPVGTEKENRSVGGASYYIFASLFQVLVAAGRPRFCLVLWDRAVGGRTIKGQNRQGSSHRRSGLLWVKLLRVKLSQLKPLSIEPLKVQLQWVERLLRTVSIWSSPKSFMIEFPKNCKRSKT